MKREDDIDYKALLKGLKNKKALEEIDKKMDKLEIRAIVLWDKVLKGEKTLMSCVQDIKRELEYIVGLLIRQREESEEQEKKRKELEERLQITKVEMEELKRYVQLLRK